MCFGCSKEPAYLKKENNENGGFKISGQESVVSSSGNLMTKINYPKTRQISLSGHVDLRWIAAKCRISSGHALCCRL